ncbi:MAG: GNAT family N-acetyltransferase [Hungatella sp.]|jgi:hypothetical protein|nr:GNAT family N-acetyltransferase [Hungatella sp.]
MIEDYILTKLNIDSIKEYGVLDLVWQVFLEFEALDYSDEGIQEFKKIININSFKQRISKNGMLFWGFFSGETIAGVIAARQNRSLLLDHHPKSCANFYSQQNITAISDLYKAQF